MKDDFTANGISLDEENGQEEEIALRINLTVDERNAVSVMFDGNWIPFTHLSSPSHTFPRNHARCKFFNNQPRTAVRERIIWRPN